MQEGFVFPGELDTPRHIPQLPAVIRMENNPYAAPTVYPVATEIEPAAETIRRAHIKHEVSVKGLGTLYFIGFVVLLISIILMIFALVVEGGDASEWAMAAVFMVIAFLYFWIARGLRALKNPARIAAIVFAAIGLLGFPLGTLISIYILYLLLSRKGSMVFSPEYKLIIEQTPHVRYKTSVVVWIVLGIIILAVVGLFIFVLSTT